MWVRNESGPAYWAPAEGESAQPPAAAVADAPKGFSSDYVRWAGGAGQPVEYKNSAGQWVNGGAPEHAESASYLQTAFADPQVEKLFALNATNPSALNNEQKAFMSNPTVGLDSLGQNSRWGGTGNLFDNVFDPQQAGGLIQTGGDRYLSAADRSAGQTFNQHESPAAQSARSDSGGLFGGGFGGLLLSVGLAYLTAGTSLAAELGAVGTGALIGGTVSAVTGGDPLKGAAFGAAGGALGSYTSGLEGGANYTGGISSMDGINEVGQIGVGPPSTFSPSGLVNAAGRAGIGVIGGQDPEHALIGAGTGLAGGAVGDLTDNKLLGSIAGGLANGLISTSLNNPSVATAAPQTIAAAENTRPTVTSFGSFTGIDPAQMQAPVFHNLRKY